MIDTIVTEEKISDSFKGLDPLIIYTLNCIEDLDLYLSSVTSSCIDLIKLWIHDRGFWKRQHRYPEFYDEPINEELRSNCIQMRGEEGLIPRSLGYLGLSLICRTDGHTNWKSNCNDIIFDCMFMQELHFILEDLYYDPLCTELINYHIRNIRGIPQHPHSTNTAKFNLTNKEEFAVAVDWILEYRHDDIISSNNNEYWLKFYPLLKSDSISSLIDVIFKNEISKNQVIRTFDPLFGIAS